MDEEISLSLLELLQVEARRRRRGDLSVLGLAKITRKPRTLTHMVSSDRT